MWIKVWYLTNCWSFLPLFCSESKVQLRNVSTARERQKIKKMAEPDKLNIDSIIQRLLEGEKEQIQWGFVLYCKHKES